MKRRGRAALLFLGLLLQLVLGVADPSCLVPGMGTADRADSTSVTVAMAPSAASDDMPTSDEMPCDIPSNGSPDAPRRTPPLGATASCHALAPCGVSFVVARPCEAEILALVASHATADAVFEPTSVAFPPDSPPPRA